MKTHESILFEGKKIKKYEFIGAMMMYGEEEGFSYDEFDCVMTWKGILEDATRSDGKKEREVWLPILKHYF